MNKLNELFKKAEEFETKALPKRKSLLERLADFAAKNMLPINMEPFQKIMKQYPSIDKNIQSYLNSLGSPFKLTLDGKKGPETDKALDWFKQTFGLTPTTPDSLTYQQIIAEYSAKNNTKGLPYSHELNEEMAQKNRELQEKS